MSWFDKILLLLLILLMPLGIVISRAWFNRNEHAAGLSNDEVKQVQALLTQPTTVEQPPLQADKAEAKSMTLLSMELASQSGVLRISGVAPNDSIAVRLAWFAFNPDSQIPEFGGEAAAKGSKLYPVQAQAFMPQPGGSFTVELPIGQVSGEIEVRLDQGKYEVTGTFDTRTGKMVGTDS